jgi:signal transduction histidine kinase
VVRICQEAIHNALRHGQASAIEVSLGADRDNVEIVVADDGVGFEPGPATRGAGSGLAGMRERAREIGGSVTIDSRPGAGARVFVQLPAARNGVGNVLGSIPAHHVT